MPENNPLHLDMRTREYLKFRGRVKGLGNSRLRDRVDLVMEQCGLTDVSGQMIGHLSKGYRQRVGLADALVHDPELIILDEPTAGLDPHQIREVRRLIKDLGKTHTVLLSTHLLPEVEMTCSRVLILHEGRMLAADTPEQLQRRFNGDGQVIAEIAAPYADLNQCWREMEHVEQFDVQAAEGDFFRCALTPRAGVDLRLLVFDAAREHGWQLRELTRARHTLEDVFVDVIRSDQEESL
jgi:ABC-2 type transport system ATP-binding protein